MNGRMYDPLLGRMLSPDNEVQAPGFTQSYNRYSYVFNNPLKYTDPSGWGGTVGDIDDWWNSQIDASYNSFNGPSGGGSWGSSGIYGGGGGYGSGGSWSSPTGSWSGTAGGPQGFWTTVSEVGYYGSTDPRGFSPQTYYYNNTYDYFTFTGYTTPGLGPDNDNYSGVYGYTGVGLAASGGSGGSGSGGVLGEAYAQSGGGPPTSSTSSAGAGNWGTLTIVANTYNETGSDAGHAWLILSPNTGGSFTFSLWGNKGDQEFWINLEKNYNIPIEVSRTVNISVAQYNKLINYAPKNSNWTPWYTCAGFSSNVWNYVTGESLNSLEWFGTYFFITTPRQLQKSINLWNKYLPTK